MVFYVFGLILFWERVLRNEGSGSDWGEGKWNKKAKTYAGEAITGTKIDKRNSFLELINDCMAGMIGYCVDQINFKIFVESG
jgi:hypothetical protein